MVGLSMMEEHNPNSPHSLVLIPGNSNLYVVIYASLIGFVPGL